MSTNLAQSLEFKNFEYHGWQQCVDEYHRSFGPLTAQMADHLMSSVSDASSTELSGKPRMLLDVACGPGYVTGLAKEHGWCPIGVDFSEAMVAEAEHNHPDTRFVLGDAEELPFSDEEFLAVVMNFGILHLAQPDKAIAEAYRVLGRGGRFAFTVWATPNEARGFAIVLQAVNEAGNSAVPLPPGPPFFRFSDPDETYRALQSVGFRNIQSAKIPLLWHLPSGDQFFDAFYRGTARTGGLLRAQTDSELEAVRRLVIQHVSEQFGKAYGVEVNMPAWVYSAEK